MKNLIFIFILLSVFISGYSEGEPKNITSSNIDTIEGTDISLNSTTPSYTYQNFKYDFTHLDLDDEYDIFKKKRRRKKRRRSGTIDESLIYFSAGTGILILTPTILSATDKDVNVGGALAADFILAGILTYAFLKETR